MLWGAHVHTHTHTHTHTQTHTNTCRVLFSSQKADELFLSEVFSGLVRFGCCIFIFI